MNCTLLNTVRIRDSDALSSCHVCELRPSTATSSQQHSRTDSFHQRHVDITMLNCSPHDPAFLKVSQKILLCQVRLFKIKMTKENAATATSPVTIRYYIRSYRDPSTLHALSPLIIPK